MRWYPVIDPEVLEKAVSFPNRPLELGESAAPSA